jgi:hypothetical protein
VLFGSSKKGLPYPKEYIFERAELLLSPKRDQLIRLLGKIGLKCYALTSEQLIQFFFSIYNPGIPVPGQQKE